MQAYGSCVQMFADQGLRTLCCAMREISTDLFLDWKQRHHIARLETKTNHYIVSAYAMVVY